ncbi:hypothetical protein [Metabacillus sediminilitoris]|jgi:hypothetical protein|uniref:Uncharacterized protein n=1 Tax=Metabacillus sediminilitoris TaxID=2567941 RepID=A0A4S4CAD7_9BACI|nr:hypothetical protein [Metabacillus sediminilitoris]QGQ46652.1 hypothetical protein GMB29_16355 [Metabacillus sediminilitoris]THF82802.1 hypothetical protein E6W99_00105 [Metabacillus sediminilitoris]
MKNIIEKSVIVGKLAELEQELFALEGVFLEKISTQKMEMKLEEDALQIDKQLTEMISRVDRDREAHLNNDNNQFHASCFPFIATNLKYAK